MKAKPFLSTALLLSILCILRSSPSYSGDKKLEAQARKLIQGEAPFECGVYLVRGKLTSTDGIKPILHLLPDSTQELEIVVYGLSEKDFLGYLNSNVSLKIKIFKKGQIEKFQSIAISPISFSTETEIFQSPLEILSQNSCK